MKALFTLTSAIDRTTVVATIALISLVSVIYPEIGLAAASGLQYVEQNQAQIAKIKNSPSVEVQTPETVEIDPLAAKLEKYLIAHKSPLAPYAAQMITLKEWKKALAISFVESNMGIHCADNNCSGIGGAPGTKSWRKYSTKYEWFKDMDALMETPRYSEKYNTFRKMKGVYVQPGSEGWINGSEKVYAELTDLEEQATQERVAMGHGDLALANTSIIIKK